MAIGRLVSKAHQGGLGAARPLPPRSHLPSGSDWAIAYAVGLFLGIFALVALRQGPQTATLLILAALFPFVAMIVGNARRLLLAIILVDIPFSLDSYIGYQPEPARLGAIGGLNLSATTIALVVLYALWLADILTKEKNVALPRLGVGVPLAVYIGLVALSVTAARNPDLSFYEIALLSQMFLLYLYIASTVRTRGDVFFIVTLLLVGLALEGAVILASQFAGLSLDLGSASARAIRQMSEGGEFSRVQGTVGSPNVAASYLSFFLPLAMATVMAKLPRSHRWATWIAAGALGLGGLSLVLTFSRGGWMAFALSMSILVAVAWRRGWVPLEIPLVVGTVALIAAAGFQDAIVARLLNERSALDRLPLIGLAWDMIAANPVLGVGANNFAASIDDYAGPEFVGGWLYTVHNKYLLIWAEAGILTLLAYGWFLVATLRRGWLGWRHQDRFLALTASALTAALMGQMIHMFFDVFNSKPQIESLWLVAGLLTAISRLGRE